MYQKADFDRSLQELKVKNFYQIYFMILPICDEFYG